MTSTSCNWNCHGMDSNDGLYSYLYCTGTGCHIMLWRRIRIQFKVRLRLLDFCVLGFQTNMQAWASILVAVPDWSFTSFSHYKEGCSNRTMTHTQTHNMMDTFDCDSNIYRHVHSPLSRSVRWFSATWLFGIFLAPATDCHFVSFAQAQRDLEEQRLARQWVVDMLWAGG